MGQAAIKGLARERQTKLRTMARGIAGSSRMDKTRLVEALAAQRSPYSDFSDDIKKAEAATEVEWLSQIARIAKATTSKRSPPRSTTPSGTSRPSDHPHHHQPAGAASVPVATRTAAPGKVGTHGAATGR